MGFVKSPPLLLSSPESAGEIRPHWALSRLELNPQKSAAHFLLPKTCLSLLPLLTEGTAVTEAGAALISQGVLKSFRWLKGRVFLGA